MKLIGSFSVWYRMWSIQLAAAAGVLAATVVANPGLLLGLVGMFPGRWRWLAAAMAGAVVFILPALTRLAHQPKLNPDGDQSPK